MRTTTIHSRRVATAAATVALAGIVTAAPAFARPDPGEPVPDRSDTPAEVRQYDYEHRGPGATTEENKTSREQMAPTPAAPGPGVVTLDDDAVEYLQIGLGILGGMALVGGAVATSSARRHHRSHAHPA